MYEKEILETYTRCNIKTFPLDCLAVIRGIGYTAKTYGDTVKSEEERKILMTGSSDALTYFEKRIIYYNERAHPRRIRFSLMHEVGHIVLDTDSEDAADAFAASILAPIPIARRNIIVTADYVCKTFDVSVAMANRVVMACKGKMVYDRDQKALIRYFDSFDEKEPKKREPIKCRTEHRDDFPDNWNDLMLAKRDFDLYFY